jgi:hypothetical protein
MEERIANKILVKMALRAFLDWQYGSNVPKTPNALLGTRLE